MIVVLLILLGAFGAAAVAVTIGRLALERLAIRLYWEEQLGLSFVLGSAIWSSIVFALCTVHGIYKAVLIGLAAVIVLYGYQRRFYRWQGPSLPALSGLWKLTVSAVAVVFGVLYLSHAMAPEVSPDGAAYHLGLVGQYFRGRGFVPITTSIYANLSQAMEMLFLLPFAIGRHPAAAMSHLTFLFALPWLILCYGRRIGQAAGGAFAAILFFCAPVIGLDGVSAYNDVATASAIFTVFYLLQIWKQERAAGLLTAIGIAAGFAFALKYTALVALPFAIATIAWNMRREGRRMLMPLLRVCAIAAVLIVPWLIKNSIVIGNPVSPFLNSVFKNPHVHIAFEQHYQKHMAMYALTTRSEIPLQVTVKGDKLTGLIGPVFLLSPLLFLLFGNPAFRPIALAGLLFLLPYPANVGTRFLIPVVPFLALSIGIVCARLDRLALALALLHAVLSWPTVIPLYAAKYAWRIDGFPWKYALYLRPAEEYLFKRVSNYRITREIERVVPPGKRILGMNQIPEAYTRADFLVGFQSATGDNLVDIFQCGFIPERRAVGRTQYRFPRQKLNRIRLVQNADLPEERWSVAELRVSNNGQPVERNALWRVRSSANPWDAAAAFDNSLVTRWSSWEPRKAGMFLEVEFPAPVEADEVWLEISRDQTPGQMTLEGYDSYGNKYVLSANTIESEIQPQRGLRLAATRELMARGIDYLLLFDHDYGWDDVWRNSRYWGMEVAAEKDNARLYRLLGNIPPEEKR